LDRWGSKAAVLGHGLAELLRHTRGLTGDESLRFFIDKHGGRNTYSAMLQEAFPDGVVTAQQEGMACSADQARGLPREIRLPFQPGADASHFGVALASMVSKYLREVLMRDFNRFWQRHAPDLKPTAGYPGDAARFFERIRPVLANLGLAEEQ